MSSNTTNHMHQRGTQRVAHPATTSAANKRSWANADNQGASGAAGQPNSRPRTSAHLHRPTFVFASTSVAAIGIGNGGSSAFHAHGGGGFAPSDFGGGPSDRTGSSKRSGSSPRRLTQREKNREAVRKCRMRKKLHAQELNERAVQLEEENAKLRMQLQLGNEEVRRERSEQGENLLKEIETLVAANQNPDVDVQLRKCVTLYVERHHDNGRDRQSAIGYILSRLSRLLQPTRATKMYLLQMAQEQDSFFDRSSHNEEAGGGEEEGRNSKSEWAQLCEELELTKAQEERLMHRRTHARLLRSEFAYTDGVMNSVLNLIRENKRFGDGFAGLTGLLQPRQFAKFVLWVHNDPACKDILNQLWDSVISECDKVIDTEQPKEQPTAGVARLLLDARRDCVALSQSLFELKDVEEITKLIPVCFDDDITVVDPNNGGEVVGIQAFICYVMRLRRAFVIEEQPQPHSATSTNMVQDRLNPGNSTTSTNNTEGNLKASSDAATSSSKGHLRANNDSFSAHAGNGSVSANHIPGTSGSGYAERNEYIDIGGGVTIETRDLTVGDSGKGHGTWRLRGLYKGKMGSAHSQTPVCFDVVAYFSFAPGSEKIIELVLSFDAVSLMQQIQRQIQLKNNDKPMLKNHGVKSQLSGEQDQQQHQQQQQVSNTQRPASENNMHPDTINRTDEGEKAKETKISNNGNDVEDMPKTPGSGHAETNGSIGCNDIPETSGSGVSNAAAIQEAENLRQLNEQAKREREAKCKAVCVKLAELFEAEPGDMTAAAGRVLDPQCVFIDSHIGGEYQGTDACAEYAGRIRGVFPSWKIWLEYVGEVEFTGGTSDPLLLKPSPTTPNATRTNTSASAASTTSGIQNSNIQAQHDSSHIQSGNSYNNTNNSLTEKSTSVTGKSTSVTNMSNNATDFVDESTSAMELELGPSRLEVQMRWEISAMYSGALVKGEAHECSLSADVFVACCPVTWRVVSAQFSFNAADLMQQLGVLHESA